MTETTSFENLNIWIFSLFRIYMRMANFKILNRDNGSAARRAVLTTAHGKVETPAFIPVGTAGAVKGITPQQLKETGSVLILANTYHLLLRPGVETIEKLGGLHKFMAWDDPILTDSGGYQIFSMCKWLNGDRLKDNHQVGASVIFPI